MVSLNLLASYPKRSASSGSANLARPQHAGNLSSRRCSYNYGAAADRDGKAKFVARPAIGSSQLSKLNQRIDDERIASALIADAKQRALLPFSSNHVSNCLPSAS
jgi:hypothetical protein